MIPKHSNKYIFPIMGLMILFALYLQYAVNQSTEKLKEQEIRKAEKYAEKIVSYIQSETGDMLKPHLAENPQKREALNKMLDAFLTEEFQYIFLLQKDKKGHYRFLLDGSLDDPVAYNTIFFPKSELYDTVYHTKTPRIIKQKEGVEHIWLSLLYPIVEEGKTQALLVLDLSRIYGEYLNDFNSPVSTIVILMELFLLVSFLVLAYFAYHFYKLRKSILFDPLTSAYTKLYLQEFFDKHKVDRYNAILVDIDDFKQINEKYGYDSGNKVLELFVREIMDFLPEKAKIIRTGGAEFLVILSKEEADFEGQIQKLFRHLTLKRYLLENEVISLSLSMSAIVVPEESDSIRNIERLLDEKLLEVKSRGKNGLGIIGTVSTDEIKYKDLDYIKEALEEERLLCLYQPIVDTKTKEIVKYEALVRLVDKEDPKKLIEPVYFLDRIKGTTQYIKLSKLVLREVFRVLHHYPDLEISFNVDLYDLYNADMMQLIDKKLYQNQPLANRLTFEILENHEIKDFNRVSYIFNHLKAFGSKIAIDDYGSGYANSIYLVKLETDILKIDGSLIQELSVNPERAKVMLNSIKALADSYHCEVVAEYVSSEKIYDMLIESGIPYAQGYYCGKPKPIEELSN
ncbi:MAG: GGDEF and EAL domain-containing protein [Sulfurimonas sp.]